VCFRWRGGEVVGGGHRRGGGGGGGREYAATDAETAAARVQDAGLLPPVGNRERGREKGRE
jgi:hypothetical protein